MQITSKTVLPSTAKLLKPAIASADKVDATVTDDGTIVIVNGLVVNDAKYVLVLPSNGR